MQLHLLRVNGPVCGGPAAGVNTLRFFPARDPAKDMHVYLQGGMRP